MLGSALFMLFSVGMAAAQDQVIQVGAAMTASNPFIFSPPNITAKAGSVITFNFSGIPGFHSVSQAAFNNPCQLMDGGFSSGFVEIGLTGTPAAIPQWNLTITNGTTPIWFFCQQLAPQPHCPTGMVGSINAPTSGSNTFEAFQAAARSSKGTPGQGEGGLVGVGASASAPPSPLNTAGVSGLNNPTMASAPSSTGSVAASSTPSSTGTASGAVSVTASSFVALIASFIGLTFA